MKKTKAEVDYGEGRAARHCSLCRFYLGNHACSKVQGYIDPHGLCDLFEHK